MVLTEVVEGLKSTYEFNEYIKDFGLEIKEKREHHTIHCLFRDTYGVKYKSIFFIPDVENPNIESINNWIKAIVDGVTCVKRLNDKLNELYDDCDTLHIYYRFSLKTEFKSYIYDWDYDSIIIALSRKSIQQLISIIDDLIIEKEEYTDFENFIATYKKSSLAIDIGIELDSDDTYEALIKHMTNRDEALNIVKGHKNKRGKIEIVSILSSKSFGVVGKFKWEVNFDTLDIKVSIENNKVYSVQNKEFIRDVEILGGIEKLYKPTAYEIAEIFK